MPKSNPLRLLALSSAVYGLVALTLTQEIAIGWLLAGWLAWIVAWVVHRYPFFLAGMKRFETAAVAVMVLMLLVDFFVFRFQIFIALTHFLLLFQILKLLGEKARKDCLQIFLFSFFQVLAACTLSVDSWHGIILLGLIPTATAVLFWNQIEREWEQSGMSRDTGTHRSYRRMAAGICLFALPFTVALAAAVFAIFPRLTLNAQLPGFGGNQSGYQRHINLAQKGRLQMDSSVVLWLSFGRPEDRELWSGYLRGDVLSHFDGRQWSASKEMRSRRLAPDSNGIFVLEPQGAGKNLLHHTVMLADTSAATLFVVDKPLQISTPLPALEHSEEGNLHWVTSWRRPLRYEVVSAKAGWDTAIRPDHRHLPAVPLERIQTLVGQVAGDGTALDQARAIELHLQQNYKYSNDLGERISDNPIDEFLFERRAGPCGYFASAMAVMLRLKNIPSRIVAGYLKGEWNEPAQCIVIRERDAHAWVEAYIQGQGWVSFDPSPRQTGMPAHRRWMTMLSQYWIYLDLQWNRMIIQYDLYAQIKAFETLKGSSDRLGVILSQAWARVQRRWSSGPRTSATEANPSSPSPFPVKKGAAALIVIGGSLWLFKRNRMSYDSAVRFYGKFLQHMARSGCPKQEWETGAEFVGRLIKQKPKLAQAARDITDRYYLVRYKKDMP